MRHWLLTIELIDSPLLVAVSVAALMAAVALLWPGARRWWRSPAAAGIGAALGSMTAAIAGASGAFPGTSPAPIAAWAGVGAAGLALGVMGLASPPWWRRTAGAIILIASVLAAALGVNASFGLTHNLGAVLGVQTLDAAPLPPITNAPALDPTVLAQTWRPPADMPAEGRVSALSGADAIPADGYAPRDAALYLPPAALGADPPRLPLIVFMMGQPGTPDPTSLAAALNAYARSHQGLAPIAVVVDQLGSISADPACADSARYGAVASYVNDAVPRFALSRLNVLPSPDSWTIAGYSNGGACALAWAAQHPQTWGAMLDISGNEFPGSEHVDRTIAEVYGGDRAAFEAASPAAVLAAQTGGYDGHLAMFTWGADDAVFGPGQRDNARRAADAGFSVVTTEIPGTGHTGAALDGGLAFAIPALCSWLGWPA